jgi:hypothetical protein
MRRASILEWADLVAGIAPAFHGIRRVYVADRILQSVAALEHPSYIEHVGIWQAPRSPKTLRVQALL